MSSVEDEDYNMRTFDTVNKDKLMINFRKLSTMLGIHKDSYNHVNPYKVNTHRLIKMFKLKDQPSIEPINEEEDYQGQESLAAIPDKNRPKSQGK